MLPDHLVEATVGAILNGATTGKIGDGKIFLTRIDEAIRIRNQEYGSAPLKIDLSSSGANSNLRDKINLITVA